MDQLKNEIANADPFQSWWPFIIAGTAFIVTLIRHIMGGQLCPVENNVEGQIVIVTGSSGGIGLEIVKELCRRGAHVVMACRDIEKTEKIKHVIKKEQPSSVVYVRYLDLRSFECVRRFVTAIEREFDKIDVLINNAGINFHPYEKTTDNFEAHLQVNFLSPFLLTYLLGPLLKESIQGRVINISAHAYAYAKMNISDPLNIGSFGPPYHSRDAFAHSKLAVVLGTRQLAKEFALQKTKITINVCSPGLVRGTDHFRQSPIMRAFSAKVITYPWMWLFMKSPRQGAQTAIYLTVNQELKTTTGIFFNDCEMAEPTGIAKLENYEEKLYDATVSVLKLPVVPQE